MFGSTKKFCPSFLDGTCPRERKISAVRVGVNCPLFSMIRPKNYSKTPWAGNTIRPNRRKMPRASVGNMKIYAVSARARGFAPESGGLRLLRAKLPPLAHCGQIRAPTRLEDADSSGADFACR